MTEHLDGNRRLIVGRALFSGAVSLIPVPLLDDYLAERARGALLRRLAELRQVALSDGALATLTEPSGSRLYSGISLGVAAFARGARLWQKIGRKIAGSLFVFRRLDEAIETYQVGTLFDHYCARHRPEPSLDTEAALRLRQRIDRAIHAARGTSFERAFRQLTQAPGLLGVQLAELVLMAARSRGVRGDQAVAESASEGVLPESRWIGRTLRRLEDQVLAMERGYVGILVDAFDAQEAEVGRQP